MTTRLSLVSLLILAASASVASAATITVPDDFTTIQAALNTAAPGDTVQVKDTPGPYSEKVAFPNSGTAGNPITLTAFAGHSPILDGTGVSGADMVLIDSKSHVRVVGFEIRNNTGVNDGSGVRVVGSGTDIEIRNNRIHDIRGLNAMGITVFGTEPTSISNLIIDGNEIYDCQPAPSETLTLNGNVELFEVTNNYVHDVNNIGIDFIGGETDIQPDPAKVTRNGVCRDNRVERARSSYGGGFAGGIYVDGGKDIVIERNVVTESDLGIEIGAENNGIVVTGVVVRDNLVFRNDKVCLAYGGFAANVGRVKNSSWLNNTCYHNDTLSSGFGELWIQYAEDNVVRNNIFVSTPQNLLVVSEAGNVNNALDYNLWFTDAGAGSATFIWQGTTYPSYAAYLSGSGQDAHSLFADPQFIDAPGADFHLVSTSPAVDTGDPGFVAGVGETDIDASSRVSGGRVDIGADEVTCGDGNLDAGEVCDDGDLDDCDGCDHNCTPSSTCGNGVACAPEQCDDGNAVSGDCCSATCTAEPLNDPCDDGDACTNSDACDGAGSCGGTAEPLPLCRAPIAAGKSSFTLKDKSPDSRDLFVWRWTKGAQTDLVDLGDPTDDNDYTICVYDQSANPQPILRSALRGGGVCPGGHPCWRSTSGGFRYGDRFGLADGARVLTLKSGSAGKAKIVARGKGDPIQMPALPLTTPVTVQVRNDAGECWGASYAAPLANDTAQFRARGE